MLALGIDLSQEAIGLAALETTGRTVRLVGSWEEDRDPSAGDVADELRRAVRAHCPGAPDAVASAIGGGRPTFRILDLPFSEPGRLAAIVPFELEEVVPFDLAESVTSFVALGPSDGGTSVLAAIAPRDGVATHIAELRSAGVEPAIVDVGTLAVAGLVARPGLDLLVFDVTGDGGIALVRDGRVTGLHLMDAGRGRPAAEVVAEARWSALALAGDAPLPPLLATDPGADAARGLARELSLALVDPREVLPGFAAAARPEHLRAIALAARAADVVRLGVNLRSGDLAYHAPRDEARRQVRTTVLVAGAAAVLALAFAVSSFAARRAELAGLRARIAASVREVLPNPVPGTERAQLEAAIESLTRRRETLAGGVSGRPPALEILRSVADAVPAATPLEIQDMTIETEGIRLHARTDSYESVDVVKRALEAVPGTGPAQIKDVKTGVDGRVEFRASLAFEREGAS